MVLVRNCIREIRKTVFGRDMRAPIANACEHLKNAQKVIVKRLESASTEQIGSTEEYTLMLTVS